MKSHSQPPTDNTAVSSDTFLLVNPCAQLCILSALLYSRCITVSHLRDLNQHKSTEPATPTQRQEESLVEPSKQFFLSSKNHTVSRLLITLDLFPLHPHIHKNIMMLHAKQNP